MTSEAATSRQAAGPVSCSGGVAYPGFGYGTRDRALPLAQVWCQGHIIDGGPALGHAVQVTQTLGRHTVEAPPHVVAACLLHDAPDLVADRDEMVREIVGRCGGGVVDFIDRLHAEHAVLNQPTDGNTAEHLKALVFVPWLMHAAIADKIVALDYATGRAANSGDPAAFWAERPAFVRLVPYFRRIHQTAQGIVPEAMSRQYEQLLTACP